MYVRRSWASAIPQRNSSAIASKDSTKIALYRIDETHWFREALPVGKGKGKGCVTGAKSSMADA
jgi:hypothetical protein